MSELKSNTNVGGEYNSRMNNCDDQNNINVINHSNLSDDKSKADDDQSTLCSDANKNINAVENEQIKLKKGDDMKPCVLRSEEGSSHKMNTENSGEEKLAGTLQNDVDVYENNHDVDEEAPLKISNDAQEKELTVTSEMEEPDIPIDSGWAWMVVLGAFFMHVVVIGGCKSFGVLFVLFQDKYDPSAGLLGTIMSMPLGLLLALGVFTNMLSARLTCRTVMFMGGIIGCAGFFLSAFMSDFVGVVFTFGIMGGIAFSCCYSPGVVMVNQHFKKYRSLASGFAVAGSGVGTFAIPNLMRVVDKEYGLPGCLIIFSGIALNLSVIALLFRPWSHYRKKPRLIAPNDNIEGGAVVVENLNGKNGHSCKFNEEQASGDRELRILPRNGDDDTDADEESVYTAKGDSNDASNTGVLIGSNGNRKVIGEPVKAKKKKLFDWSLLSHPVFFLYALSNAFAAPGYGLVFVMLPEVAEQKGHDRDTAALITSIIGIFDLSGRLFFGWFSDLNIIPKRWGFIGCMALSAFLNFILPSISSFSAMVCYAVAFGLFCGSFITLTPVLLAEDLGTENLGSSFGVTNLFMAVAYLTGPLLCGSLKDLTGSWDAAFYFIGVTTLIGALLPCFQPCGQRYVEAREREKRNSPVD